MSLMSTVPVRRELHPAESACVGALSGIIEVLLQQPSVTVKNFIQDKKPINFDPRVLYRGVGINASSIAPIIAIQFGVNSFLQRSLTNKPTAVQVGAVAGAAGMVSSICSAPAELLMIQQQKSGLDILRQAQIVAGKHGWFSLFRGLSPTAVREGIFTASYLGMKPFVQEELMIYPGGGFKDRPNMTNFVAAAASGMLSAIVTHPFDTIKTRVQANLDLPCFRMRRSAFDNFANIDINSQGPLEGGRNQAILLWNHSPDTEDCLCGVHLWGSEDPPHTIVFHNIGYRD